MVYLSLMVFLFLPTFLSTIITLGEKPVLGPGTVRPAFILLSTSSHVAATSANSKPHKTYAVGDCDNESIDVNRVKILLVASLLLVVRPGAPAQGHSY